jgi:hypothetical protein
MSDLASGLSRPSTDQACRVRVDPSCCRQPATMHALLVLLHAIERMGAQGGRRIPPSTVSQQRPVPPLKPQSPFGAERSHPGHCRVRPAAIVVDHGCTAGVTIDHHATSPCPQTPAVTRAARRQPRSASNHLAQAASPEVVQEVIDVDTEIEQGTTIAFGVHHGRQLEARRAASSSPSARSASAIRDRSTFMGHRYPHGGSMMPSRLSETSGIVPGRRVQDRREVVQDLLSGKRVDARWASFDAGRHPPRVTAPIL